LILDASATTPLGETPALDGAPGGAGRRWSPPTWSPGPPTSCSRSSSPTSTTTSACWSTDCWPCPTSRTSARTSRCAPSRARRRSRSAQREAGGLWRAGSSSRTATRPGLLGIVMASDELRESTFGLWFGSICRNRPRWRPLPLLCTGRACSASRG